MHLTPCKPCVLRGAAETTGCSGGARECHPVLCPAAWGSSCSGMRDEAGPHTVEKYRTEPQNGIERYLGDDVSGWKKHDGGGGR